jgi:hypothetical protein
MHVAVAGCGDGYLLLKCHCFLLFRN